MTEQPKNDPALEKAKEAHEEASDPAAGEDLQTAEPSPPVPNPDEDELTGIAPE